MPVTREGDLDGAGDALGREWEARKLLAPGVSTRSIERLGRAARGAGARAMKVCGAGGGGCVVLWCDRGSRSPVERAARDLGHRVIRFRVATEGVR